MRRILPLSLVVLFTLQTACNQDEATAPQRAFVGPTAQLGTASNVPSRITFMACNPCFKVFVVGADGTGRTQLTSKTDFEPSFSPDGQLIAFSRWVAGELALANIFVMAADGSGLTELDVPGGDKEPSWSPDGRRIAFTSRRDNDDDIYVMGVDGSAPTNLTNHPGNDVQPSWSPDGRHIAFVSVRDGNNVDIYVMAPDGSGLTRVTDDPANDQQPAWSPDSRQIVFQSDRDGNAEIYVMGADGSAPTRLTDHPGFDGEPNWSPTGQIAFHSNRDGTGAIYLMNADGSDPRRLTTPIGPFRPDRRPRWGPWLDQTPPQLNQSNIAVAPQRWFGALTGYNVSATDDFDPDPEIACTPPSPSIFPIGTTEVRCTATDNAGNTATGSFPLTVRDQFAELAFDVANLEGLIDDPSDDKLSETLAKVQAAREEFARTPVDRLAALHYLLNATENLYAALDEGEISRFGFDVIGQRLAGIGRLTADQAIHEAEVRGGDAEAIAAAKDAFVKGDAKLNAREFSDAVAQYRKACSLASGA